jgi:hypothetical protein
MASAEMDRAVAVKAKHEEKWLKLPGVTGVDVGATGTAGEGTGGVVIRVYVADRRNAPPLPTVVEGIPVIVIERRFNLQ